MVLLCCCSFFCWMVNRPCSWFVKQYVDPPHPPPLGSNPGQSERPANRLRSEGKICWDIQWHSSTRSLKHTLSLTRPCSLLLLACQLTSSLLVRVAALLSQPTSLSSPPPTSTINPLHPSPIIPRLLKLSTYYSQTSWSLSPPPSLLFGHWVRPISSSPGPSEQRLPFLLGSTGSLSVHRLTALQWLSTLLRCVLPVSVARGNRPPAWQLCRMALWTAGLSRAVEPPALLTLDTACVYLKGGFVVFGEPRWWGGGGEGGGTGCKKT